MNNKYKTYRPICLRLFVLAFVSLGMAGCSDNAREGFTIKGKIDGIENCQVGLIRPNIEQPDTFDTLFVSEVVNGEFELRGEVDYPTAARLKFLGTKLNYIPREIVVDNELYRVRGEYATTFTMDILGGDWHEKAVNRFLYSPDYADAISIYRAYKLDNDRVKKITEASGLDEETKNTINRRHRTKLRESDRAFYQEINSAIETAEDLQYKAILLSLYNWHKIKGIDSLMISEIVDELGEENYYSRLLSTKLNNKLAAEHKERMLSVGNKLMDVSVRDKDGSTQNIYQHITANKITLVEFWASWCRPCRVEIPKIKETYEIHSPAGFEVVSISIDESKTAWETAYIAEDIPWVNYIDDQKTAVETFNILGIPFSFLVDSQGTILAKGKDLRGQGLDEQLRKHLGHL